jgi:Zn-dependent peptidase ImmA (M78 family)
MLIFKLIATLGLLVTFSETPAKDCNSPKAGGCYWYGEKRIVLILNSGYDLNQVLYHEVGHAIETKESTESSYDCWQEWINFGFSKSDVREIAADYFAEYISKSKHVYGECPALNKYYEKL